MPIRPIILKAILKKVKTGMLPGIIRAWLSILSAIFLSMLLLMWIVYCFFGLLILFLKDRLSSSRLGPLPTKRSPLPGLRKQK